MCEYARGVSVHSAQRVRERNFDVMYGSSGTIQNLSEMVVRRRPELGEGGRPYFIPRAELEIQARLLCEMSLEERRRKHDQSTRQSRWCADSRTRSSKPDC